MRQLKTLLVALLVTSSVAAQAPESFNVPLPHLTVEMDAKGRLKEVFISYGQALEGCAIGDIDDRYVKANQKERIDHFHREIPQYAYLITDFEAEQLKKVAGDLTKTLEILERDLQRQHWGRLKYLDSYLAPFMYGFYYLVTASRCSRKALPLRTNISPRLFDEQDDSPLSNARVNKWKGNIEDITRLRIATREFIYQIEQWQKKDLGKKRENNDDFWQRNKYGTFERSYELFVTLYFAY